MDAKELAGSSVASRFVSETQLTAAQKKREEDIRAAYARMGQSPPPEAFAKDEEYDPRTLYEKLKAKSDAKQEMFEEKMKLSNQFRGIDDAESEFLAEIAKERQEEQRKREEETRKELEEYRRAAVAKESSPPGPIGAAPVIVKANLKLDNGNSKKAKRKREGLLGIVKKKVAKVEPPERQADKEPDLKGTDNATPMTKIATSTNER